MDRRSKRRTEATLAGPDLALEFARLREIVIESDRIEQQIYHASRGLGEDSRLKEGIDEMRRVLYRAKRVVNSMKLRMGHALKEGAALSMKWGK